MAKITKEAALLYHSQGKPGKIEVVPTKPYSTQTDLSLAYSPGVAEPCLEIEKNPQDAYKYTAKGNLVAVISNGTAVLGLGDIGALSGKPVMEGKGLLFKIYAGIDVFDIEVDEKDPEKFIAAVKAIAPTFGGINLEDIKAPECFEIERRLKEELDIPVMHDDQHGTAIISSAGLVNALQVAGKKIEDVKIVVNGAGASAVSCTKLYVSLGARLENIVMLDSKGVISKARTDLNEQKRYFATDRTDIHTLEEAIKGAAVFLALAVIEGVLGGFGPSAISKEFLEGCKKMLGAAFIIGMAQAISSIMNAGHITDTVVHALANGLNFVPTILLGPAMLLANTIINVFLTSGSGQAAAVIPILAPLADLVGVTRQTAILSFNFGDGFCNYVLPTSTALMGIISAVNIPYDRWMKFMWKLFLIWLAVGSVMLMIAQAIHLGPM